jgi:hypothetical protein
MFVNFSCSFNLSYSSFNFYNFFLDYICNFSTKFSSTFILEIKNDWNLLLKNENKELFWCLLSFKTLSLRFMKWHFIFHFKASVLMICIFFILFDICHLLLKFILTSTWAIVNTYWAKNYVDMALGNSDDILESDDLMYCLYYKFPLAYVESLD